MFLSWFAFFSGLYEGVNWGVGVVLVVGVVTFDTPDRLWDTYVIANLGDEKQNTNQARVDTPILSFVVIVVVVLSLPLLPLLVSRQNLNLIPYLLCFFCLFVCLFVFCFFVFFFLRKVVAKRVSIIIIAIVRVSPSVS